MAQLVTAGLDRLIAKLGSLSAVDFTPLLLEWEDILDRDNERGALAGLDGWGRPLAPVTYRPAKPKRSRISPTFVILNRPNDNPTSAWYRTMDGPPLAPRRKESRIVKNYVTAHQKLADGRFAVYGAWKNVLSPAGVEFLPFHFKGEGRLPVRNLAHVRPAAMREAREALRTWITAEIKKA